jgi:hypothetical protein
MNDCLRLAIGYMDGDGTARLDAAVQCKGFCGNSSGWFGISQLEEFAGQLLAYPLPDDGYPPLRAGFWSRTRQGEVDQLHVFLRVYPVGLRGAVGCLVTLRTPLNDGDKSKVASLVEVELRTSYQSIADFSQELVKLLRAELSEAILRGVEI